MIYSIILKNYSIVSDFSEDEGDFQQVLVGVLKANRRPIEFYEISYLHYQFYFLHKDEFTFSCITSGNIDQEKVVLYLNTLKNSFLDMHNKERDSFALKVTNLIRELMYKYKEHVVDNKFQRIEHELKQIETEKHNILKQALDKDMYLDTLITKSDSLKKSVKNILNS